MSEETQLDRIEKKLDHLLDHLHVIGSNTYQDPPPAIHLVSKGKHELIPTEDELRRRNK